ncbi:3-hydroxyacyl-ACP dehydratase [Desulfosarcina ovata subsp. sediminis]|uniref:3-hydroxyacyl-ACP dehydratase n=1 Tax=Desulfosarcina ovata subsp. sediminis TaxID=885957 RepID=A0A5K7ZMJ2_9BACT|nr:2-hydroxyacyl-CoA dehydratase family protein [Desulfosarcina ovata]BBO82436.1 3-hydroxyacyl-ACP dehydratase [Desulfosarcina ovata subsp. sediminis]
MKISDMVAKRTRRLLKGVARSAAVELERLRSIPGTPEELNFFYDVLEAAYVRNDPAPMLDARPDKDLFVGVYCMVVPEELIYAAGAIPVRLCAGCFESSQIGEDRVPRDGCPLVKSSMGLSMQKGLKVFDLCDVVAIPTTCDAKRKLGEELSAFKEVWMIETPHIKDADFSRRIWMEQMYALKAKLETVKRNGTRGKRINARRMAAAIQDMARAQAEMRRLLSLRSAEKPLIWGRQATAVVNAFAYAHVNRWTEAVTRLNNRLAAMAENDQPMADSGRPRIYIAGSPSLFPNLKIPTLVEEMGGVVVADESCAGDRYLYDPVGSTEKNLNDQMLGVASRYLAPCVCPSFTPNDDRLTLIQRMITDFAVDGVLYHVLKGCVVYDFEVNRVENALRNNQIPLLRVETDYNPEDVEQLRTRIEAFIEMLKSKRSRTKQAVS